MSNLQNEEVTKTSFAKILHFKSTRKHNSALYSFPPLLLRNAHCSLLSTILMEDCTILTGYYTLFEVQTETRECACLLCEPDDSVWASCAFQHPIFQMHDGGKVKPSSSNNLIWVIQFGVVWSTTATKYMCVSASLQKVPKIAAAAPTPPLPPLYTKRD